MNDQHDASGTAGEPQLARKLGLTMLVLYGTGVTVGAGIYVLIGAAAVRAGPHAPVAFLVAATIMALSAASFAELAVRMPVSAGESAYVQEGFKSRPLAFIVGLLVVAAGLISAAAISRGAAGYIGVFVNAPDIVITVCVVLVMGAIAAWGIAQAAGLAAIMTVIEIAGLLVVAVAGFWQQPQIIFKIPEVWTGLGEGAAWSGIFGAALLAFFSFIGFESTVNVVEEVKEPERTLPLAIAITLGLTTLLYILVVWVAIQSVPRSELGASPAPLGLVFERVTGASPLMISAIAVFATINGIIVQIVLSSRVLYGMSRQGVLPAVLGRVNAVTRTPLIATALSVALVLAMAVAVPIDSLADNSTRVMLVVFAFVNAALVRIKIADPAQPAFSVPIWVPVAGFASSVGLLVADVLR